MFNHITFRQLRMTLVIVSLMLNIWSHSVVAKEQADYSNNASQELRQHLLAYSGFSAKFIQRVEDSQGTELHQAKGELMFSQPDKFSWQINDPEPELLVSDGKTLWWYNPFLEQVSIFAANDAMLKTPFALLVSSSDSVWQQFEIHKSANDYIIEPINKDNAQVIQLIIKFRQDEKNTDRKVIQQLTLLDRTRQISHYFISKPRFTAIESQAFDFIIPQGIDIDDQRPIATTTEGKVQY